MTDHDTREIARTHARLAEIRKAPLTDRQDARAKFYEAMATEPTLVADRVGWLLDGSYGHGEHLLARRIAANTRMNRAAALTQMIAALEWQCPEDFARDAWKGLSKRAQIALDRAVEAEINAYLEGVES